MGSSIDNPLIILLLIVAVFGGIAAAAYFFDRRRRQRLAKLAASHGFTLQDGEPALPPEGFADFPIFNKGFSRKYRNVMTGELDGAPAVIVDYHFDSSDGRSTVAYRQTVACCRLRSAALPEFELSPRDLPPELGTAPGYVELRSVPGLPETHRLRARNEVRAEIHFTRKKLDSIGAPADWTIEGGGRLLALCRLNRRITMENFGAFLNETRGILRTFEEPQ
ncbi:MAG: hypothetical protein ABIJ96_12920 [Elusimicrobiota bacterium]